MSDLEAILEKYNARVPGSLTSQFKHRKSKEEATLIAKVKKEKLQELYSKSSNLK